MIVPNEPTRLCTCCMVSLMTIPAGYSLVRSIRYADKAIAEGTIPPMIIVMPNGDSSFYINSYDGKEKYEDFFIKEFMPSIEKTYRIKAEKTISWSRWPFHGWLWFIDLFFKISPAFAAAAPLSAAVFDDSALVTMPDG